MQRFPKALRIDHIQLLRVATKVLGALGGQDDAQLALQRHIHVRWDERQLQALCADSPLRAFEHAVKGIAALLRVGFEIDLNAAVGHALNKRAVRHQRPRQEADARLGQLATQTAVVVKTQCRMGMGI